MAGNHRSGRPRKAAEQHILGGSFREDRHGPAPAAIEVVSLPQRPESLDDLSGWLWDLVVSDLAEKGIARKLDTALLWSMCEIWSFYRRSVAAADKDPVDKDARCAVLAYWTAFERAASRCGLTPSDRARLNIQGETTKPKIASRKRTG